MARMKYAALLCLLLLIYSGFGSTMDKFDWNATDCAPEFFLMQIIKGDLYFPDGKSIYVPDTRSVHKGWGTMVSSHIGNPDPKPLPNRLDITFFSYAENEFYQGNFELPYEKILSLFQDGYYSPKRKGETTYQRIMMRTCKVKPATARRQSLLNSGTLIILLVLYG
jgi:hypothetical protein